MKQYFVILFNGDTNYGYAETVGKKVDDFVLPNNGQVKGWKPLRLKLKEGRCVDYLGSDLSCRLCSDPLKGILTSFASPEDFIQWLPVKVTDGKVARNYWILHFYNSGQALDKSKTIFAGDFVVKPVFSEYLLVNRHVFSYPMAGELSLFVSKPVMVAIKAANCSGIVFSKAAVR